MKKKVISGLILVIILLALLGTTACDSLGGGDGEVSQQPVEVTRGDMIVSVTGSGTIETSREAKLTFSSAGRVDKILVEEGDMVSEGDVLSRLDTSALELTHAQAQVSLTQAEVALTQAQLAQKEAEYNLKNTRDTEGVLKLALLSAQINRDTAQYNLEQTQDLYTWSDIKIAQADVDESERYLEYCLEKLYKYLPEIKEGVYPKFEEDFSETEGYKVWQDRVVHAQARLSAAEDRLEAMQSGRDTEETAIKRKQVEAAEMSLAQAQKDLDELAEDIAIQEMLVAAAKQSVAQSQQSVELAQLSLDETQRQLDEATITATFDGIVAQVLAKEGEVIPSPSYSPKTIIHLINPNYLELVIEVDEIDIPMVELGREAIITVDALPDSEFKGEVTAVCPVPKEEGGVVLYDVKVGLDAPENSRIRVGMSASADIIIEEHSDILLVPSRAIDKNEQGQTIVKVMSNGEVQERPVVVGLDDGLRTEILSGLSEGETVVVEVRARSTPSMGFNQ
jgi:HlyD family secretion protein